MVFVTDKYMTVSKLYLQIFITLVVQYIQLVEENNYIQTADVQQINNASSVCHCYHGYIARDQAGRLQITISHTVYNNSYYIILSFNYRVVVD